MKYAIEALRIYEHKLRDAVRAQEIYSVYPDYVLSGVDYEKRLAEILKAINVLQEKEAGIKESGVRNE